VKGEKPSGNFKPHEMEEKSHSIQGKRAYLIENGEAAATVAAEETKRGKRLRRSETDVTVGTVGKSGDSMDELESGHVTLGGDLKQVLDKKVLFSKTDIANGLKLSEDRLSVSLSSGGFRSVRSNLGVKRGRWFCEMHILQTAQDLENSATIGHVRLGWTRSNAQVRSDVEAPVGAYASGFGYRDIDGSKVHDGWRTSYGQAFGVGDVVGLCVCLDGAGPADESNSSHVRFMLNGKDQGLAFENLPDDKVGFFATASIFGAAAVRFNPGPHFKFGPPDASYMALSHLLQ